MAEERKREIWLDWLRVTACFMVMIVHSTEPFYLGGEGSLVLTKGDAFWAAFFDSFVRSCVPLFIIASSYLQFPLHYPAREFVRRRAVRILVPFIVWSLVYALIWGKPIENLKDLIFNFNYAAGHMWFVYMLIGLYVLMPLLSPWAEKVGRKELLVYLGIWLFTTTIPFIRSWMGGAAAITYGPSGIPMGGQWPLWGEASWNPYGTFYYISGFIGYLLLGLYFRKFGAGISREQSLTAGIPFFLAGFFITFWGFLRRVGADAGGSYPVGGDVGLSVAWETTWLFCSTGVALMAIGWLLIFRTVRSQGRFYDRVILPLSKAGYGMYLSHMVALSLFSGLYRNWLGVGAEGVLGFWTTPVEILATAISSFVVVGIFSVLVQRIPRAGKWIIG